MMITMLLSLLPGMVFYTLVFLLNVLIGNGYFRLSSAFSNWTALWAIILKIQISSAQLYQLEPVRLFEVSLLELLVKSL